MKKRGKILFAIIMLGAILINLSLPVSAHSLDTKEIIISEDSPERHNGVELTWENGEMYNQLCTVENSEMAVRYIYDNEGRRIGKTGEKSIVFAYDEVGNMILESGFGYALSFNYDDEGSPRQLIYNGDKFKFELDSDGNVYRLLDSNNKAIAMYQYQNGETVVYGLDEQNKWVINKDPFFIGNINKLRFKGYYYDEETRWYYCGRYYDMKEEVFIDGQMGIITEENPFLDMVVKSSSLEPSILAWRESLMKNASYGKVINYSANWYNNLSVVEIVARLIYGENTQLTMDQCAEAWVIRNRVANKYFGNDVRGVVTYPGQFATITAGNASETKWAREPVTSSRQWGNATLLACILCTTTDKTECEKLFTKPSLIDNQLHFVGMEYFFNVYVDSGNKTGLTSSGKKLTNCTVVTEGTSNSAKIYTRLQDFLNDYPVGLRGRNVYFDPIK